MFPIRLILLLAIPCLSFTKQSLSEDFILGHTVEIEFGKDRGQAFGNLFELVNEQGEVVAGAGFLDVYNTQFRNDRFKLQFYLKNPTPAKPKLERFPVPARNTGLFIFDEGNTLYGWTDSDHTYEFNTETLIWSESKRYSNGALPRGLGGMKLAAGHLNLETDAIRYNDQIVLSLPKSGRAYNFYYAQGHLFFFHLDRIDDKDVTKVYAVAWKPGDAQINSLKNASSITCRYPRTTPFSWGQHNGRVITVGNYGGIYTFVDGKWIEELEGSDKTSYQVYAQMHYNGQSYMAQYPTGNLFAYDKGPPVHKQDWPPKLPEVVGYAREAMSLGVYGGRMYVGVWPWAELWRVDSQLKDWQFITRGFTHPALTAQQAHPYEDEAVKQNLVRNHWGQRITSLVPHGNALYLATSSKGPDHWKADRDFLPREKADEYGSLLKLTLPGTVTVPVAWNTKPIQLRFYVLPDRIEIRDKDVTLGSAKISREMYETVLNTTPRVGTGVFGPTDLKSVKVLR